jgi:hypothetical protein
VGNGHTAHQDTAQDESLRPINAGSGRFGFATILADTWKNSHAQVDPGRRRARTKHKSGGDLKVSARANGAFSDSTRHPDHDLEPEGRLSEIAKQWFECIPSASTRHSICSTSQDGKSRQHNNDLRVLVRLPRGSTSTRQPPKQPSRKPCTPPALPGLW